MRVSALAVSQIEECMFLRNLIRVHCFCWKGGYSFPLRQCSVTWLDDSSRARVGSARRSRTLRRFYHAPLCPARAARSSRSPLAASAARQDPASDQRPAAPRAAHNNSYTRPVYRACTCFAIQDFSVGKKNKEEKVPPLSRFLARAARAVGAKRRRLGPPC